MTFSIRPRVGLRGLIAAARRELGATTALLVLGLAALAFSNIADEVVEGETHGVDQAVLDALRVNGQPKLLVGPNWLHTSANDVTALGSLTNLTLIVLLVVALMACLRRWSAAVLVLVGAGGGLALSQGLKALFGRERPDMAYRTVEAVNASFPSGHAMMSAVVFLTLGALATRFTHRRRIKTLALGSAVLLSLLVGISRIYLGVHWSTDVLAGWCLGAAWAMACWLAAWAWERRQAARGEADGVSEAGPGDLAQP
jgi:undecaprenyl-diphosphatase